MAFTHRSVMCVSSSYLFTTFRLELGILPLPWHIHLLCRYIVLYRSRLTQVPQALDNCSSKVCIGELPALERMSCLWLKGSVAPRCCRSEVHSFSTFAAGYSFLIPHAMGKIQSPVMASYLVSQRSCKILRRGKLLLNRSSGWTFLDWKSQAPKMHPWYN